MNENPERLSDIDINVHGFTAQDVIDNRKARKEIIRDGAIKGNWFCLQSEWLDAEAKAFGIDITYNEDLDAEDLE